MRESDWARMAGTEPKPNPPPTRKHRPKVKKKMAPMTKRTVIEPHETHRTTQRSQRVDASILIRGLSSAQTRRIRRYVSSGPYEETIGGRRWRFTEQEDGRIGVVEVEMNRPGPQS